MHTPGFASENMTSATTPESASLGYSRLLKLHTGKCFSEIRSFASQQEIENHRTPDSG
jgi:hypothetical protein